MLFTSTTMSTSSALYSLARPGHSTLLQHVSRARIILTVSRHPQALSSSYRSHTLSAHVMSVSHNHNSTEDSAAAAPWRKSRTDWSTTKRYQGSVRAVILDWAGTVVDCGVFSPVVVFLALFEQEGVPVTLEEARAPMGVHKRLHVQRVTELPSVRRRWFEKRGRYPTDEDVERMFVKAVPLQLACLEEHSAMITGAVDVVNELQKKRGLKIGTTTGYTEAMLDVLRGIAAKAGYVPDSNVAADQVPQARPAPLMIWQNCIQLNVHPLSAVVKVDDTTDGIMEGIAAGTWSVGVARTGNYMALKESELGELQKTHPEEYGRMLRRVYEQLANAGAHYVIDDIRGLPSVIDDINRRLAQGEHP